MKRLPKLFAAVALGTGCSAPPMGSDAGPDASTEDAGHDAGVGDAGSYDAGPADAGTVDAGTPDSGVRDAGPGTPYGDAGCVLPSDFPWDAGYADVIAGEACQCVEIPEIFHCFEENGPRCFSWSCPPQVDVNDGGYVYQSDGGIVCLC